MPSVQHGCDVQYQRTALRICSIPGYWCGAPRPGGRASSGGLSTPNRALLSAAAGWQRNVPRRTSGGSSCRPASRNQCLGAMPRRHRSALHRFEDCRDIQPSRLRPIRVRLLIPHAIKRGSSLTWLALRIDFTTFYVFLRRVHTPSTRFSVSFRRRSYVKLLVGAGDEKALAME